MNLQLYYAQLEAKCPEADDAAKDVIRRAATEGSQDNMEASDVLVHGDFGARNILIDAADLDHLKLFVIDWEMCCPGRQFPWRSSHFDHSFVLKETPFFDRFCRRGHCSVCSCGTVHQDPL